MQDRLAVNHYDRLKVTPDAPVEVIRAAYRAMAGKLHPDRQGGTMGRDDQLHDLMAALNTAYEVLIDPKLRAEYDASLIAHATAIADTASSDGPSSEPSDQGFSNTRVDVAWMSPKALGPVSSWPPSRNMVYIAAGGAVLLVLVTIWVTWQVMTRHQMERALSDQYSAHPPPAMTAEEAAEPMMPTPEPRRREPDMAMPTPSLPTSAETPLKGRQPTVAELSRMSDEQLLEVLPTLGEKPTPAAPLSQLALAPRRATGLIHHPLDGKPLNLRTEKILVDPLAPEDAASMP
ncbi:MAG: J domain-containing protein [Rubrivivax sp.]|nr:MAG: J domain-containing protein [Rubrivivax sp.]